MAGTGAYQVVSEPARISADGDSRIRNEQVLVRLTPAEAADARRLATANDLSLPALMRAGLHLLLTTEAVDA